MPVFASDIVKLLLNTGQTLTGLTVYIKYKKPDVLVYLNIDPEIALQRNLKRVLWDTNMN